MIGIYYTILTVWSSCFFEDQSFIPAKMNLSPEKGPFFGGDVSAQMEETLKTGFFTECQHITHLNTAVNFCILCASLSPKHSSGNTYRTSRVLALYSAERVPLSQSDEGCLALKCNEENHWRRYLESWKFGSNDSKLCHVSHVYVYIY